MTPLRETISHILSHEIIYSRQYELIEYGKAGDRLETLFNAELAKQQPPAGPVWVKASQRLPEKFGPHVIVRNLRKDQVTRCQNLGHDTYWDGVANWPYKDTEWLSEDSAPAQQLFTREQLEDALFTGIGFGLLSSDKREVVAKGREFMNSHYPREKISSNPQSFTRRQVEMAFYAACNTINYILKDNAIPVEKIKELITEYMKTNYGGPEGRATI